MSWKFLSRRSVEAFHADQLRRHGGAAGLRDGNALESALGRAENKVAYGEPDLAELAAAYMFGLARNHAFVDGNKRTAIVSAGAFLDRHGYDLTVNDGTLYEFVIGVASGEIGEEQIAQFFRDHLIALEPES